MTENFKNISYFCCLFNEGSEAKTMAADNAHIFSSISDKCNVLQYFMVYYQRLSIFIHKQTISSFSCKEREEHSAQ